MCTKSLRILFVLFLVLFSLSMTHVSLAEGKQKGHEKRFEVFEKQFHLVVENSLISLESHGADLGSILVAISKGTGIEIEIPSNLQSRVSAAFESLPLETALKKLVSNRGIVFSKKNETGVREISKVFCLAKSKKEGMKEIANREPLQGHPAKYSMDTPPQPPAFQGFPNTSFPVGEVRSDEPGTMAPHELIVKFKKDFSEGNALELIKEAGASIKSHIAPLGYYVLSLPHDLTIRDALGLFQGHDAVEQAEPNYLIPIKTVPNDPAFSDQWSLDNVGQNGGTYGADIDAPEAWDIEEGNERVIIAVVDTGVDYTHPDLSGNIWHNPGEIPNNGIDDDGNGYVDDTIGWDFVDASGGASDEDYETPDNNPMDRHGHGTHVAGIAGAVADNGIGIAGVAWRSKIMPVRAGFKTPSGGGVLESDDAAQAIVYAAENGARVINLSWGDSQESNIISDAIDYAAQKGALICAAAGNENSNSRIYPAASDNNAVIAVGATDSQDHKASFSNYGDWLDVFAPGTNIYSTYPINSYREMSGTSMATPHVSGLAALLFSYLPEMTAVEAKARIMRSADVLTSLEGKGITSGRINAFSALTALFDTPHIFSLNPAMAHEGDQISIFGDRFGNEQGNGSVLFDSGQEGEIISWSNTVIVCRMPEGVQSGGMVVNTEEGISNSVEITVLPKEYEETLVENAFLGRGDPQGWKADDRAWPFELPFTFSFFGRQYNSVTVSSNGFLLLSEESAPFRNSAEKLKERAMIAPLWDDLITNGSSQMNEDIYIDKPSADAVCIRWKAEHYEIGDAVNVEVMLYKDGRIMFNYGQGNTNLSPTIGISSGDGTEYRLAPYDGKGQLNQVQSILFTPLNQCFSISLNQGWNLISLPLEPSENQVSQVLGSVSSNLQSVWGFEKGSWKVYFPSEPGMSDLNDMKSGYGYWVKVRKAGVIEVKGGMKALPLDLMPGWNLIGIRSLKSLPVAEALSDVEGRYESVWGYKNGKWELYGPQHPGLSDFDILIAGMGYWVKISAD